MNELIPFPLQKATFASDLACTKMMNLNAEHKQYDFAEGVYDAMPKDPRG
jgi:hypothetical protein